MDPFSTKSPTSAPRYKTSPDALDFISTDEMASITPESSMLTSSFLGATDSFL